MLDEKCSLAKIVHQGSFRYEKVIIAKSQSPSQWTMFELS